MNTDGPLSGKSSRPLQVTIDPAPGTIVVPGDDPSAATVRVSVVQVPVTHLPTDPVPEAASPSATAASATAASSPLDPSALPDDPRVLKQMIAEVLGEMRGMRRDQAAVQQRLDALLRRLYGPRPEPVHPDQPLLFPEAAAPEPPPLPAADAATSKRRGRSQPHGRRRPARTLRREPRRYELTAAERQCPECHGPRAEIGVETTSQYDYRPAEVFVIEHQRVKYACPCCAGQVVIAPKPPQPLDKGLPGAGLLAQIIVDKYRDHIPLHRSEQRYERLGAALPRSTMCDWMAAAAVLLTPLCQLLKE